VRKAGCNAGFGHRVSCLAEGIGWLRARENPSLFEGEE
jgi:hypothetical protein